ncbi:Ionotropic receptor 440 [Blattella germanica]|nr:Ionotropic receptor 440 [Blattella germanica]
MMEVSWSLLLYLVILSFQSCHSNIHLLRVVSPIVENMSQCIVNIAEKYLDKQQPIAVLIPPNTVTATATNVNGNSIDGDYLIHALNNRMVNSLLILDYRANHKSIRNGLKPAYYILLLSGYIFDMTIDMGRTIFESYKSYPSARIIIASTIVPKSPIEQVATARRLLQMVWEGLVMYESIAIVPNCNPRSAMKHNLENFGIFGWFPQKQSDVCLKNLNRVDLIDSWLIRENKFVHNFDMYTTKYLPDMRGCTLTVQPRNYPLLAYVRKSKTPTGLFLYFLKEISKKINMKLVYLLNAKDNVCDVEIPVAYLHGNFSHIGDCLSTYPHIQDSFKWVVPAGSAIPRWKSLIKVFSPAVWAFVVLVFVLGSLTSWLLFKYSSKKLQNRKNLSTILIDILLNHLGMGISDLYSGWISKLFLGMWLFYCLIINAAYQSALLSFLANPGEYPSMKTNKELYDSDIKLCSHLGILGPLEEELRYLQDFESCVNVETSILSIPKDRNTAVLTNEFEGKRCRLYTFSPDTNKPQTELLAESVLQIYLGMYVNKLGCLLYNRFEELMGHMVANGIVKYQFNWVSRSLEKHYALRYSRDLFKLSLTHLQGGFYLFLFGVFTSFSVFCVEILLYGYSN